MQPTEDGAQRRHDANRSLDNQRPKVAHPVVLLIALQLHMAISVLKRISHLFVRPLESLSALAPSTGEGEIGITKTQNFSIKIEKKNKGSIAYRYASLNCTRVPLLIKTA